MKLRRIERKLVSECTICLCDACTKAGDLKLKVIAHTGQIILKQVRQFEEIAGEDVILAHRLLKNSQATGEYLLLTDAFHALSGNPDGMPLTLMNEDFDDHGKVKMHVHLPDAPANSHSPTRANLWRRIRTTMRLESYLIKRLLGAPAEKFHHLPAARRSGNQPI